MQKQIEKVIDGVTYVGNPELLSCSGCVGDNHDYLCDRLCEGVRCRHNWSKKPVEQPMSVTIEGDDGVILRCTEEFREKLINHPKVIEVFNTKHGYTNVNPPAPSNRPAVPPAPTQKTSEAHKGIKTDTGKPRFTLIPPFALEQVAICLTEGLKTHPDKDNWKLVENGKERFLDSLYRHWNQYQMGEVFDRDNPNVRNLSAIIVNALFALEFEVNPELNGTKEKTND